MCSDVPAHIKYTFDCCMVRAYNVWRVLTKQDQVGDEDDFTHKGEVAVAALHKDTMIRFKATDEQERGQEDEGCAEIMV